MPAAYMAGSAACRADDVEARRMSLHERAFSEYWDIGQEDFIMSRIYTAADQLIGHTPLLELTHIDRKSVV